MIPKITTRICKNCKFFLPNNNTLGWCLQFYKKTNTGFGIEPRCADYCRNIDELCGKEGKYFIPNSERFNPQLPPPHIDKSNDRFLN
jgi:hypothetical protein